MRISEYRALDRAGRLAARERAKDIADWGKFGAAKLILTEAAEQIRKDWPTAVAVVVDVQPYEHYTGLLSVQGSNEVLLWTRPDGILVDGSFASDDEEADDAAHEAAELIADARSWKDDVLDEVGTWRYVMWLSDWLEPEVDDPDGIPPGAVARPASIPLDRLTEILVGETSVIGRDDAEELMSLVREAVAAHDAAPSDESRSQSATNGMARDQEIDA